MGNTPYKPLNEACFDDPRGGAPIVTLMSGAIIHYVIVLIFVYWKNEGLLAGIFKMLWASVIAICAMIQLVLDYIVGSRYFAFDEHKNDTMAEEWQRYNCQVYLFSSGPNIIHV